MELQTSLRAWAKTWPGSHANLAVGRWVPEHLPQAPWQLKPSLDALLLHSSLGNSGWVEHNQSVPVLACATPSTNLRFLFHGQGRGKDPTEHKSAVCCVWKGSLSLCWRCAQSFLWTGYPRKTWDALFESSSISTLCTGSETGTMAW